MMIPIRCMTCGKPVGHLWEAYRKSLKTGLKKKEALDKIHLERYCCRALFLTQSPDLIGRVGGFRK